MINMVKIFRGCLIIEEDGGSLRLYNNNIQYIDSFGEKHYYSTDDIEAIEIQANILISIPVIEKCIINDIEIIFMIKNEHYTINLRK